MRLDFRGERVLAVVAHPDDAELLAAGTLLRAKADGGVIGIAYLCLGDRGQPADPVPDLPTARRSESLSAAKRIGADHFSGVIPDGTLSDSPEGRAHLLEVYRAFRPTLVLAHAPNDYHPDHRAAAALAEAVSWYSASRAVETKGLEALDQPPALWWMDTLGMTAFEPSLFIDISESSELKGELLTYHRTQLARSADGEVHPLSDLMIQQMTSRGREAGVRAAEAFRPYHTLKRTRAW